MGFKEVQSLDTDVAVTIGGFNKKTKKDNPKTISGYYLGARRGIPNKFNPDKPNSMYVLQTPKGNVGVWGKTNLDAKMQGVTPGAMVRISFSGTRPSNKGNDMLLYKVEVDLDNTIDVSNVSDEQDSVDSDSELFDSSEAYSGDEEAAFAQADDEETSLDDEEARPDEVAHQRAVPPKKAATAPDAARQAKVKALLTRSKATA